MICYSLAASGRDMPSILSWLVASTHLKNISQNGNLPQIGVKIKNMWNHHLVRCFFSKLYHTKLLNLRPVKNYPSTFAPENAWDKDFQKQPWVTHRIHVWYIYPHLGWIHGKCRCIHIYIYVYIYVPYMDPMGSDTFESQLTVKQPPKAFI